MTATSDSPRRASISIRVLLTSALALLVMLMLPTGVALAHTSFEQSTPANGETISEPVDLIVLQFSGDTEYGDDGFTILAPDGMVRTPSAVTSLDERTFELSFDPPLAGGEVGVRWSVNAPDAHTINGTFSFTVTAPTATSTSEAETPPIAAAESPTPAATTDGSDATVMADGSTMDMSSASLSLDEFLAEQPARSGEGTARWGRTIELAAFALLIGGGAFTATTLRGRRSEIDRAVALLRILGASLAVGALLEYVGVTRIADASLAGYWSSQPGLATLLRAAGGIAVAVGLVAVTAPIRTLRPAHSLSAAVNSTMEYEREEHADFWSDDHVSDVTHRGIGFADEGTRQAPRVESGFIDPLIQRQQRHTAHAAAAVVARPSITISTSPPQREARPVEIHHEPAAPAADDHDAYVPALRQWVVDRSSSAAFVGVVVALISFWFDGHTVSKGLRPLHAVVNSVHVVAGSVWLGGVVAMAVVLWTRHRAGLAPRALEMVVRFSGIATVALGAVIAAGGMMAFLVLDSVGELFSTQWGQVLLLKSAAAALAMAGGAYNHFRLLPALEADPDDPELVGHLRSAVTSEAILLCFVIVVTASLVAAAS